MKKATTVPYFKYKGMIFLIYYKLLFQFVVGDYRI